MEGKIVTLPSEMVKIIPTFGGDARLLPLFIKKCEYIIDKFQGNELQNEYLFHVITSRLVGEAAALVGERDQIESWTELKSLLQEHFGDPRTEDCLVLELESTKIQMGENYEDFCHRIQHMRSVLIAKVNETTTDQSLRSSKHSIYTNTSLRVFLHNLPPYLVRLVRMRNVTSLEAALRIVLEEQNFQKVYASQNNNFNQYRPNFQKRNFQHTNTYVPNRLNNFVPNNNYPSNSLNSPVRNQGPSNYNHMHNFNEPGTSHNFTQQRYPNQFQNNRNSIHRYQNNPPQNNDNQLRHNAPNRQFTQRSPYDAQRGPFDAQLPSASGCNTDVTMRTASSRRVNYTENYNNNDSAYDINAMPSSSDNNVIENFCIRASTHRNA